jgi:hypothetical protein
MQPLLSNPKYANTAENSTGKNAIKRHLAYKNIYPNNTTFKLRELRTIMEPLVSSAGRNSSLIMRINIAPITLN